MYQSAVPLIHLTPAFRNARLAEVELGRLILLRASADSSGGAGVGVRADALSARGELTEGVLRLSGGPTRFERAGLAETVIAIEVDYLLEADLASAAVRAPTSGDLIVASTHPCAGVFVANLWPGTGGLLDIASAVIRPFAPGKMTQVALSWKLVERDQRTRILLERSTPEPFTRELPRRVYSEDCD